MFNVNNKDTRMTSIMLHQYFSPISSVSNVEFEQINICWSLFNFPRIINMQHATSSYDKIQ